MRKYLQLKYLVIGFISFEFITVLNTLGVYYMDNYQIGNVPALSSQITFPIMLLKFLDKFTSVIHGDWLILSTNFLKDFMFLNIVTVVSLICVCLFGAFVFYLVIKTLNYLEPL